MATRPAYVYNGSGWDDIGDKRIGAEAGDIPQASVEDLTSDLASKLPYSYGTATPTTSVDGFLWYDDNDTPPTPKFWDGAAFQALTSGKILQVVRATDSTDRSTTSTSYTDASLSITITPTKSTSAIFLVVSARAEMLSTTTNNIYAFTQITDNSNNAISGAEDAALGTRGLDYVDPGGSFLAFSIIGYATPATTSAVTYKVRFKTQTSSASITLKNSANTAQMFALEIGA